MIPDRTQKNLYTVVSNLVRRDFRLSNPAPTPKKDKQGKPIYNEYFLSEETREALEMYAMSISKNSTADDEKRVNEYYKKILYNNPSLMIKTIYAT
jgi:hypothetical protein